MGKRNVLLWPPVIYPLSYVYPLCPRPPLSYVYPLYPQVPSDLCVPLVPPGLSSVLWVTGIPGARLASGSYVYPWAWCPLAPHLCHMCTPGAPSPLTCVLCVPLVPLAPHLCPMCTPGAPLPLTCVLCVPLVPSCPPVTPY